MQIQRLGEGLSMIDVQPPIPGWEEFIGPYVLGDREIALVDVGPSSSAGNLIAGLKALDIDPHSISYILLTHVHLDHAGAVGEVMESLPNARVVVHPRSTPHLVDTERLWEGSLKVLGELAEKYGRPQNINSERVIPAEDGMVIRLEDKFELEVIHTPGHAAHHVSFLERNTGNLFAGEAGGVYNSKIDVLRPATPPPFSLEDVLESIDKLLQRDLTTIYYGHFGSGGDARRRLLQHREQLQLWQRVISKALEEETGFEEILHRLTDEDVNLKGLGKLPEEKYQREWYFMRNDIEGFMGYIRKRAK